MHLTFSVGVPGTATHEGLILIAPYLATLVLQVLGLLAMAVLRTRVIEMLQARLGAESTKVPTAVQPEGVANLVEWGSDVSQSLAAVAAPAVGLLLLLLSEVDAAEMWIPYAYLGGLAGAIALFLYTVGRRNPTKYLRALRPLPITPVGVVAVLINGGGALFTWMLAGR